MAAMLLAVGAFFAAIFVGFCFVAWAFGEHLQANKYRELNKNKTPDVSPNAPVTVQLPRYDWVVTYKEGKKTQTVGVNGKTEGEALQNLIKQGKARYDSIVAIERGR